MHELPRRSWYTIVTFTFCMITIDIAMHEKIPSKFNAIIRSTIPFQGTMHVDMHVHACSTIRTRYTPTIV